MESKRLKFALFYAVTAMFWFSLYTYVSTLPVYAKGLGASYKMAGVILGSYGFTQMLLRIPVGILSDKLNRRKIFILLGITASLLSGLGLWLSKTPGLLLVSRGMAGVAAASWVQFTVLFSSYFEASDATRAMGYLSAFCSLGQVAAMFLGGIAAQQYGLAAPFLVAVIGAVIAYIPGAFIHEGKLERREPVKLLQLLSVAKDRRFLLVAGVAILLQFQVFSTIFGFTPVMAKKIGADSFQLGLLSTVSTIPVIFASFLSGSFFAKRFGEKRTIIGGFTIFSLTSILIPYAGSMTFLYVTQVIGGFSQGLIFPLLMGLCIREVEARKRATAMGFFQALYGIGMFIGPVIVGAINDSAGLTVGFWTAGLIGFAAVMVMLLSGNVGNRATAQADNKM